MSETSAEWSIRRYTPEDARMWDERVRNSRNGTFLHLRGYMDYHADRFNDCSLIAMRNGKTAAMLPADITPDGIFRSHGGLTYGGWILPTGHTDASDVCDVTDVWLRWCRREGISHIVYRPVPHIYHRHPSEEDIYALFRHGARLEACGLSSTINYADPAGFNSMRRRLMRKASALGGVIEEMSDVEAFHKMLTDCLAERHDVAPVHSVAELQMLRDRFPDNIRIFTIALGGEIMAGVCMYLTDTVAHSQYIATTPEGRRLNMLTPLFAHLIDRFSTSRRYFDFGVSTEEGGRVLNAGLLRQKFSFGGGGTLYPTYTIDL